MRTANYTIKPAIKWVIFYHLRELGMTSAPITTNDLALRAQNEKLSLREKIGYGLGDAGGTISCLIWSTFSIPMFLG